MRVDWPGIIRRRNRRVLLGLTLAFVFACIDAARGGAPAANAGGAIVLAGSALMVAVVLRWRADPSGGGVAVRRELLRQGTIWKHAWAWLSLPFLGAAAIHQPTSLPMLAVALGVGAFFAQKAWRDGAALIRRGNG